MSNPEPSYVTAYYRFRERIHSHIGVGPYEPIPTELRRQWVQEFKDEIDAWCDHMDQLRREAEECDSLERLKECAAKSKEELARYLLSGEYRRAQELDEELRRREEQEN